jgi:DNA-binding NarL/FixJ family response regulator
MEAKGVSSASFHCATQREGFLRNQRPSGKGAAMARSDSPRSSVRILLVDDFEPWRRHVHSIIQTWLELCVVAEVADGVEAVQRAQELKPDLILLDIGLPSLNGIEAANRIRKIIPDAKIIFVTQNSDKDVVRAALSTGAHGYVLKTDAARELITAMAGVLGGDDFVSSGIKEGDSGETEGT